MRNVSDKICRENQTHILHSVTFFFFVYFAIYEMMWKNKVEPDRPQMTIHTHTHTHTHFQNI